MRIYIIRHGQTELNNRQLLQGRSDYPLNSTGIGQAEKAAERLRGVTFMKGLLEYLTPGSNGAYWSRYIGNCAIDTTEYKNGKYIVPKAWYDGGVE